MSDVFLSYSRADRAIAEQLAGLLEQESLTVWWDPHILPGSDYRDILKKQLEIAHCVVVLWSPSSVQKRMVKEEAHYGHENNKLIPALIETAEIPFGFTGIEAADLCGVTQFRGHPEFINLLTAIKGKLGPSNSPIRDIYKLPGSVDGDPLGLSGLLKKPKIPRLVSYSELLGYKLAIGVMFEDHFKDNSKGWSEKRDHKTIVMRVMNGKYSIDHIPDSGSWYTWLEIPISKTRDFEIEVEIAHLFSASKYDKKKMPFYGVNWGGSGANDMHEIQFSYDGYFCYKHLVDGEWFNVIPWKKTPWFNELDDKDIRSSNNIQVVRKANVIEFRLNGSWLEDADFDSLHGDNIGFSVHRNFEIEVNHIKVTQS